jgi:hypothetical protein
MALYILCCTGANKRKNQTRSNRKQIGIFVYESVNTVR